MQCIFVVLEPNFDRSRSERKMNSNPTTRCILFLFLLYFLLRVRFILRSFDPWFPTSPNACLGSIQTLRLCDQTMQSLLHLNLCEPRMSKIWIVCIAIRRGNEVGDGGAKVDGTIPSTFSRDSNRYLCGFDETPCGSEAI